MNDLIFLDTETTGLDPEKHEVWEIAWAINDGPVRERLVPHSLLMSDPVALSMNGYYDRINYEVADANAIVDVILKTEFKDATVVAANPTFDRMMLRTRWGMEPWHHRSIDIESVAMSVLNDDRPPSMKNIVDSLIAQGYDIPQPDHSAKNDVIALRHAYYALRHLQRKYIEAYHKSLR